MAVVEDWVELGEEAKGFDLWVVDPELVLLVLELWVELEILEKQTLEVRISGN